MACEAIQLLSRKRREATVDHFASTAADFAAMAGWMGLEIPSWLLVLIAVGVIFLASRQVSLLLLLP